MAASTDLGHDSPRCEKQGAAMLTRDAEHGPTSTGVHPRVGLVRPRDRRLHRLWRNLGRRKPHGRRFYCGNSHGFTGSLSSRATRRRSRLLAPRRDHLRLRSMRFLRGLLPWHVDASHEPQTPEALPCARSRRGRALRRVLRRRRHLRLRRSHLHRCLDERGACHLQRWKIHHLHRHVCGRLPRRQRLRCGLDRRLGRR
jgi:hypothetical protein